MSLVLEGVRAGYGDSTVLHHVDVTVPAGRTAALLGPNGAGKTTLLSVVSGLVPCRSGRVRIDGGDVTTRSSEERVALGLCHIQEGRSIFRGLTVRENLRLFAAKGGEGEALERGVAAFPWLGERLNQVAGTLSGGQQQMLAITRSYITTAPYVLLDEVSMGLAPIIVDEIFEFLGLLTAEGRTVLLVEQYVTKALAVADLVYILAKGSVVFAGEPEELAGGDILSHYLGGEMAAETPAGISG